MDSNPEWNSFWKNISGINTTFFARFHHLRIFSAYKKILGGLYLKKPDVIESVICRKSIRRRLSSGALKLAKENDIKKSAKRVLAVYEDIL